MNNRFRISWLIAPFALLIGAVVVTLIIKQGPRLEMNEEVGEEGFFAERPVVELVRVDVGTYRSHIEVQGFVRPRWSGILKAETTGRMTYVSELLLSGARFKQDEILAQIDPIRYRQLLAQAETELASAQLGFQEEQQRSNRAQADWKSAGLSGSPDPMALRKPQLNVAQTQLRAAESAFKHAQQELRKTTVRAPYTGAVKMRAANPGDFIEAGINIATIYATDLLQVDFSLTQAQMSQLAIREGESVQLHSVSSGRKWAATVARIGSEVSRSERRQSVFVEFQSNAKLPLVGEFVSVRLTGSEQDGLLRVPEAGISKSSQIWYMNEEQQLGMFEAQTAFIDDGFVYVRAPDNFDGIDLVLSPSSQFFAGVSVQTAEQKKLADEQGALASQYLDALESD